MNTGARSILYRHIERGVFKKGPLIGPEEACDFSEAPPLYFQ